MTGIPGIYTYSDFLIPSFFVLFVSALCGVRRGLVEPGI